jgi:hypothetical protein
VIGAETAAEIVDLAVHGTLSQRAIARVVGHDPKTVASILRSADVAPGPAHGRGGRADGRTLWGQSHVSDQERQHMAHLATREGLSFRAIARSTGRGETTVRRQLRRAGVAPMNPADRARRYPMNERAFAVPSPARDYIAGLLAADGNVHGNRITLVQRTDGVEVLDALLTFVECARPPGKHSSGTALHVCLFSAVMAADLAELGIVPAKSKMLSLADELAVSPAAWLGLLDGDGTVQATTKPDGAPRITFTGAAPAMRQCSTFWQSTLGRRRPPAIYHPHRSSESLFAVTLCGASAQHAAEVLLAAHPTSLARKRRKLEIAASYTSARVRARKRRKENDD